MSAALEALVNAHDRIVRMEAVLADELPAMKRELLEAIIDERDRLRRVQIVTAVAGLPCVAEVAWTGEVPVGHVEPVDSSAAIPDEQLERADRGAE